MSPLRSGATRALLIPFLLLSGCVDPGSTPVAPPVVQCEDASILKPPRFSVTRHKGAVRVKGRAAALPNTQWAKGDSVLAFFGGKDFKVVFTLNLRMYLAEYKGGQPTVTIISQDDEGMNKLIGSINSPLFSPDGKKIVFAGTTRGKPAFVQEVPGGETEGWRMLVDPKARTTADPHWHVEGGRTYIYFSTLSGLVNFTPNCGQVAGATYRAEVTGDTTMGPFEVTGIPGAYRGGISKDGQWAGTSYASSALFDRSRDTTLLLAGGEQQCNPSMNPYPAGSRRSDYMMILAFGETPYNLVTGKTFLEGRHENLWIYNRNDRIVWQARRPDETMYVKWEKPEWSTHPDFATAVAIKATEDGDLYAVRIGDLSAAEEDTVHQAKGYLKIAEGGFNSDSYSHLWVAE